MGWVGELHKTFSDMINAAGDHFMAHKNHWTILPHNNSLGCIHVVGEGYRRILNNNAAETVLGQDPIDLFPTGSVHEAAVARLI